ncbi:hypothetical protein [Candidatus Nitrosotenuis uzonensis]|uniref:Uncharacterized protein n=1 Tax=Candidatus Nitrosotenuis uzonensis TaxID=1407055 RepID=V6ATR3_9ARCH|nr:hypothetical protein [Candidatus Nitrosotenuis uzonensis]CDI05920.1 conserved exported hypothetical protein [Candidatus Nitrosotenuis uzonensis]
MFKIFIVLFVISSFFGAEALAQEPRLATFHEVATIFVDQRLSNNVTASVSLQTTSIQEFQIPAELDAKIRNNTDIVAVIITNEDQCVLGVQEQICILINTKRIQGEGGIRATQERAKEIGNSLITEINKAFSLETKFHSVFIHYGDVTNQALETTGDVSGTGTVSAVYTAPMQSTDFMFNRISASLIPKQIRGFGGFYDVATELSKSDNSRMTFSILPKGDISVMQLKVAEKYPHVARGLKQVDPLQYLRVDQIKRSGYYSVGFFPLNSLVQVVILPQDDGIDIHARSIIKSTVKNNQTIPADLSSAGWFVNTDSEKRIEAIYLFGTTTSAGREDLLITFDEPKMQIPTKLGIEETYIIIGIGVAAAVAVLFYLRGMRNKH